MKHLVLFVLLLSSLWGYAQHTEGKKESNIAIVFSPGIVVRDHVFADASVFIGKVTATTDTKIPVVGSMGFRIGMESNFRTKEHYTIAPKIGYEINPMFLCFRLSAVNYFQHRKSEFRILPELGFSLGGWANLTYGYGIALENKNLHGLSPHSFTLTINWNKSLRKETFKLL